jgi:hypothetical protein
MKLTEDTLKGAHIHEGVYSVECVCTKSIGVQVVEGNHFLLSNYKRHLGSEEGGGKEEKRSCAGEEELPSEQSFSTYRCIDCWSASAV